MKHTPEHWNQNLDRSISGFHQYCFEDRPRLCYVSGNLLGMLGYSRQEPEADSDAFYINRIHPADRRNYDRFLQTAAEGEGQYTAQYRLLKKDGTVLYVQDTLTVYHQDGMHLGDSVLADITALKQENRNLQFLNETIPCGFLKYTCETAPKLTFINDQMKQILGLSGEEGLKFGEQALCGQNILQMIPPEDRQRFARYLERVRREEAPLAGEITVLRSDGTKARLFGWVTLCTNAEGEPEFQSACMDVTSRHLHRKEKERSRYLRALTEVYDKIFEYDLSERTVKCIHSSNSPMFRWLENIPMQMEEATEKWILGSISEEDRQRVQSFFQAFYRNRLEDSEEPPMIRYRAMSSGGILKTYSGLFVGIDRSVSLFCCRATQSREEAEALRCENTSLREINENMQKLVMRFTDGLAAFEIVDDVVTPLYASDNVCEFFGMGREEWLSVMKKQTPIRDFVSRSKAAYGDFKELLEKGEAEFTYRDLTLNQERRIKAVCSRRTPGDASRRYVMLYKVDDGSGRVQESPRVRIRTFGYFDVFVEGRPIAFRNEKSKELFALLVDRRGGFVSSEEAIGYLWEEESANSVTLARYRKVALRLKNILEEYGVADIVESVNGKRRIAAEKVQCDLYDYLTGAEEYAQLFKGSYLTNYSWGESTLGELSGSHLR